LFDWLVVGQVVAVNPAHAVRGPKHVVKVGKTPVLAAAEARQLFDADRHENEQCRMATSDAWGKLRPGGRVSTFRRLAEAASGRDQRQRISAADECGLGQTPMDGYRTARPGFFLPIGSCQAFFTRHKVG
jgi:hypothetical protein